MKNRNIFWGLIFILAAAFVLLNNFHFFSDVNLTKILITILLVYCMLKTSVQEIFSAYCFPLPLSASCMMTGWE